MDSTPFYTEHSEDVEGSNVSNGNDQKLLTILSEYKELLEFQASERKQLLTQVETLSEKTTEIDHIDNKLESLVSLLADIKNQIAALSTTVPTKLVGPPKAPDAGVEQESTVPKVNSQAPKPVVLASDDEIEVLSEDIIKEADNLDNDIVSLNDLIETKQEEIQEKDVFIEELNTKLQSTTDEKERLALQLESMNEVIGSWQGQLNLLQKLAASDPRYKVIGVLRKHGSLSDIQLAFTMGTSITQVRKYIEDLIELKLVHRDTSGRYEWVGQAVDKDLGF